MPHRRTPLDPVQLLRIEIGHVSSNSCVYLVFVVCSGRSSQWPLQAEFYSILRTKAQRGHGVCVVTLYILTCAQVHVLLTQ